MIEWVDRSHPRSCSTTASIMKDIMWVSQRTLYLSMQAPGLPVRSKQHRWIYLPKVTLAAQRTAVQIRHVIRIQNNAKST